MSAKQVAINLDRAYRQKFFEVDDPGDTGTFGWSSKGRAICEVTTAAAETRVLPSADEFGLGQELIVTLREDGGDVTITGADSTVVLQNAGDFALFRVTIQESGGTETYVWRAESTPAAATVTLDAQSEDISAGTGGAIDPDVYYTSLATDAGGDAFTLADGNYNGQLKLIRMIADAGGDGTLTITTAADENTVTFADVGDEVLLRWNGSAWRIIYAGNAADGATAPALSTV